MATNVLKSIEYEVPDSSIWEYLVEILEKEPDRVLLRVTCRHLVAEVEIYASALMSIGMNVGDTVCAYLPNTIDHIVLQLACFASGITYTGELTQVVKVSKSKVLFCYRENIDVAVDVADEVGHVQRLIVADDGDYPTATPGGKDISSFALLQQAGVISNFKLPVISDPKATSSLMLFSSGSTGTPKGVLRNHYQVICTMVKIGICHIYGPPGSVISGHQAPQHLSGNFNILSTIVCRLTMVVESSFDCDTFLRSVQLYKITTGLLTPSNAIAITKRHELSAEYDVSSLKDCVCGGSCFPDSAKDNLRRAFQLSSLRQMYGSTELGICAFTNIGETDSNYVGILAPGYEMRIVDMKTGEFLGPNQVGEAQFKSPEMALGYVDNPKANDQAYTADGFYRTGDAMFYDEKGKLFIVDRFKEVIKVGGKQVAPAELESLLLMHEAVKEAAIVGIPDDDLVEIPIAFVVLDMTRKYKSVQIAQELINLVKDQVVDWKQLRGGVEVVDALPLIGIGKVDKVALRKLVNKV